MLDYDVNQNEHEAENVSIALFNIEVAIEIYVEMNFRY